MARPALFATEGFEAALALAQRQGRWLLADFTATWCQPCRLMDRKVWCDPTVEAWVKEHAIAIQIDIDVSAELAHRLHVRSVPTVIVFADGTERDRSSGLQPPADLLAWLDRLAHGQTDLDRARSALQDPLHDVEARLGLARALLGRGLFAEALDHYDWLWCHMHEVDSAWHGVRASFMASDIQTLCQQLASAGERFVALRDQAAATAENGEPEPRLDWIVLNGCLGDEERTVGWYDAVKDDPANAPALRQLAGHLIPLLRERRRWADVGRLISEPVEELRTVENDARQALAHLPPDREDMRAGIAASMQRYLRDQAALYVRSLRAAGRREEADAVAREAIGLDDSPEMRAALAGADGPESSQEVDA